MSLVSGAPGHDDGFDGSGSLKAKMFHTKMEPEPSRHLGIYRGEVVELEGEHQVVAKPIEVASSLGRGR